MKQDSLFGSFLASEQEDRKFSFSFSFFFVFFAATRELAAKVTLRRI